jgi:hypothetical protein
MSTVFPQFGTRTAHQSRRKGNPPRVAKVVRASRELVLRRVAPVAVWADEVPLDLVRHGEEPLLVRPGSQSHSPVVLFHSNLAEDLESAHQPLRSHKKQEERRTLMFSMCLSAGVPLKSSRYGGYSESGACAKSIFCSRGMWQFVEVRKSVVSDSCHVRRRVCRDAGDMSSLQSMFDDPNSGPYKGRHIPRREHIDAYKQQRT